MKKEKNPTVCFLINALNSGGAEKVCVTLINELTKREYEIELLVRQRKETTLSKLIDPNIKLTYIDRERVRQSFSRLSKLLLEKKPDILLVFDIEFLILAHAIRMIYGLKFKIIARSINTLSLAYKDKKGPFARKIWFKLIEILLKRTDKIVAQSTGMKTDMIKNFNIPESKIKIIHNPAINLNINNTTISTHKTGHEFLFVGRLMIHKGIYQLINAFHSAQKQEPSIKLTIVGDGPEKDNLINEVKSLKLEESITIEGYTPNPRTFYKRATATILTSDYEGFPNVLVESIAEGIPVISYDCQSGPSDIIEPNINGILVEYQNLEGVTNAILDIVRGNISFESERIKNSAKKFDVHEIVNQYEELIFGEN
jgi:glycosyltransferase involved in cell wall biosynthesis